MVRKLRPRSIRRSRPLLRFRDLSQSSIRGLGLLDLKEVLLVRPSIGWLSVASKRVTVVTRVRTRSQLALPVVRTDLTVNDKTHRSSRDARWSRSDIPDSASAHPMLHINRESPIMKISQATKENTQ
jgi:hypothetical protein